MYGVKCISSWPWMACYLWNAIKPSCSDFSSPLGNNMAIFFCATTSISFSHTLSLSLSPCCLATMLVNVIPLVCDWLKGRQIHVKARKGGRHACFRHRKYKLTNYSFLEYKTYACSSRPTLSAHSSHWMSFQQAEPCMCVDACVVTIAWHAQCSACMTHA